MIVIFSFQVLYEIRFQVLHHKFFAGIIRCSRDLWARNLRFSTKTFTFEQMIPQKISWIIHVKNAEAIMRLSARSKSSRLDLAHGVDVVVSA